MSTESNDGISYTKAISLDELDQELGLVDHDDEELDPDTSAEATAEAGLTTGISGIAGGPRNPGTAASGPADAALPTAEVRFEADESGVAR